MIEAGLDTESFYREMQAMIEELQDEHSFFLSPLEVKQSEAELRGEGEFVGVGIYSQPDLERQRLIVISTFPGSPADHAGIHRMTVSCWWMAYRSILKLGIACVVPPVRQWW